ncbi:phenylacetate--CoA ligase family protein [Nocardia sp. BMG51109]|uniref:phenylacetate--CoA ligase family protein n=1 Tax=Nocardia sp. BMG51109 TaxID=1056816 RepID=UPI00046690A8|nr:phenylacetate--CoA ligase family protein [Nocardia sp. BMG51109]
MSAPSLSPTTPGPGFTGALKTFRAAADSVPAYAEFLRGHDVDPAAVRTLDDYETLPPMTKPGYLHRYPLHMLLWHGDAGRAGTWSCSSGSTGRPSYWPRDETSQSDAITLYDRVFRPAFRTHERSTLLVVGFAMGNWIGGTYTYAAAQALRCHGHRISTVTPGIEPETILHDIATLGPYYDQVVLAGYPPLVKDVLDQAPDEVLRQELRILLAGEAVTEQWRDHILERIGKPGRAAEVCVVYGTADAGVMGCETETTIAVRRAAGADRALAEALFGGDRVLPTFVEYDPHRRFTEIDTEGRFLFTVDTTLPLIRYRNNDVGAILSAAELTDVLRAHGHRLPVATSTGSCGFLALHRRTNVAASFYAVKIYPDNIRPALEDPALSRCLSGKFVLSTETGEHLDPILHLRVELRAGACPSSGFPAVLRRAVVGSLLGTNIEYRRLHRTLGAAAEPVVTVHRFGSNEFPLGVKHRWTGARA